MTKVNITKEILSAPSLTHGEPGPFNFVRKKHAYILF